MKEGTGKESGHRDDCRQGEEEVPVHAVLSHMLLRWHCKTPHDTEHKQEDRGTPCKARCTDGQICRWYVTQLDGSERCGQAAITSVQNASKGSFRRPQGAADARLNTAHFCIPLIMHGHLTTLYLLPCSFLPGAALPSSFLPGAALPSSFLPDALLPCSFLPGAALPCSFLPGFALPCSVLPGTAEF